MHVGCRICPFLESFLKNHLFLFSFERSNLLQRNRRTCNLSDSVVAVLPIDGHIRFVVVRPVRLLTAAETIH